MCLLCVDFCILAKKKKVENKSRNKREKQAPEADERGNTLYCLQVNFRQDIEKNKQVRQQNRLAIKRICK